MSPSGGRGRRYSRSPTRLQNDINVAILSVNVVNEYDSYEIVSVAFMLEI